MLGLIGDNAHIAQASPLDIFGELNGLDSTRENLAPKLWAENTMTSDQKCRLDDVATEQKINDLMRLKPLWCPKILRIARIHPLEHRSRDIAILRQLDLRNTVDGHRFPHEFVGKAS